MQVRVCNLYIPRFLTHLTHVVTQLTAVNCEQNILELLMYTLKYKNKSKDKCTSIQTCSFGNEQRRKKITSFIFEIQGKLVSSFQITYISISKVFVNHQL
jgi:hypothetical protein